MKLTRSQYISFAVLGLVAGGYILDRCFNNGPAASVASIARAIPALVHDPMAIGLHAGPADDDEPASSLHQSLAVLAASHQFGPNSRDAFSAPAWLAASDNRRIASSEAILLFQRNHQLKAILNRNGRGEALVDGSLIQVGQFLDGFKLESAEGMRARFTADGMHAELRLDQP